MVSKLCCFIRQTEHMEVELPALRSETRKPCSNNASGEAIRKGKPAATMTRALSKLQAGTDESFIRILDVGFLKSEWSDRRLSWLRSQVIGCEVEFDSPFGARKLTYADHTASGRGLRHIEDCIVNQILPFYGNTHTGDSFVGQRTTKMSREASDYIKRCLGGTEQDALLFCGSGTTGAIKKLQEVTGIAVPSIHRGKLIECLQEEERWLVFVGPHEHHSNLLSWRQSLAEVVEVGLDEDGLIDIEALKSELETYKKRYANNRRILVSFSACSNVTGICSDTRKIARLVHSYGGYVCFDFAASGPYVEIDMRSREDDGYDAVFLSPHKFLGGPGSPGILLMSKGLYQLTYSAPSTCGGGTVNYVNGFDEKLTMYVDDIEERETGGTPPIIQTIRAALAFWVKEYIGSATIEERESSYIQEAIERLLLNPNIRVLGNTKAKRQAILSFLIISTDAVEGRGDESLDMWRGTRNRKDKPLHGPFVATLLNDLFGIQARGGCACAGPYGHALLGIDNIWSLALRSAIQKGYAGAKPGWTRVSFPYYMSRDEFEFILNALEFTATYGQRFLTLYDFNWRTGNWTLKENWQELVGKENTSNHHAFAGANVLSASNAYASYLETATHIARLLPKFPSPHLIPENLDPDLLYFRI